MLAIAPFNVIAPVMLAAASGAVGGAARWATVLSAIGAGAVVGAAACARRQPRKILLGVEAAAMLSAPLALLALRAPFALVVAGSALFGVRAAMVSVLTMTAIQKEVAPAQLSRTLAMVRLANIGLLPLGYLLAGTELGLLGPAASLGFGAATTLAGVALLCAQPAIRGLEPRP